MSSVAIAISITTAPTWADRFLLDDGSEIIGVYIGEADGLTHYLDSDGKRQQLSSDTVQHVDRRHRLDNERLEKRGAKLRQRFMAERQEAFEKALHHATKKTSPDSNEPSEIKNFTEPETLPTLVRTLCSSKKKARAAHAIAQRVLDRCSSPDSVVACAIVAVAGAEQSTRDHCHEQAWKRHEELTLAFYEYVAQLPTHPELRSAAIQRIAAAGRESSGGALIAVLRGLRIDTGTTLAKQLPSRFRPLNLGNTQLTVELPVVEVFHVAGTPQTIVLNTVGDHARGALQAISGYSYGDDLAAWERWWKRVGSEKQQ